MKKKPRMVKNCTMIVGWMNGSVIYDIQKNGLTFFSYVLILY